jgi:hypothetical protein
MKKLFVALTLFAAAALASAFDFGTPVARTLSLATSYQATDTTKASIIIMAPQCTWDQCNLEVRVGTGTLDCTSGTAAGQWMLAWPRYFGASFYVPVGASFILCSSAGEYTLPIPATEQSAG